MAEVNDVDMSASQTENVKRLREATNTHSDDAVDDESSPKRPCDDRAKAALTLRAAQPPQIDLAAGRAVGPHVVQGVEALRAGGRGGLLSHEHISHPFLQSGRVPKELGLRHGDELYRCQRRAAGRFS